jgi:hypothetical protein
MTDAGIAVNVQKMIMNLKPVHQHFMVILWLYLIFFSSTFFGTFFVWNISHFGVFDASPSEEACAALPVGSSRVHETHGLPNYIVLICFQQMFGWIFNMFF